MPDTRCEICGADREDSTLHQCGFHFKSGKRCGFVGCTQHMVKQRFSPNTVCPAHVDEKQRVEVRT
jgi:hypothetical protein